MATTTALTLPMPPANANLATTWRFLEEGLDHIMTRLEGIPWAQYMSLHTVAYNYCTSSLAQSNTDTVVGQGGHSEYLSEPNPRRLLGYYRILIFCF